MTDCIFCKVIAKEAPGYFVLEEENYVAFLDIFGSVEGHTMVVPKKHGLSIFNYSKEELGELLEGAKTVAAKLKKVYNSDSITIGINHEEKKGVPHLHIHLIPRFENDGGKVIQSLTKKEIKEDLPAGRQGLSETAEKLRTA